MTDQANALTAILVTPDASRELANAQSDAAKAQVMADWPCENPEDESTLVVFLGSIQDRLRTLEAMRKTVADPLTAAKRALDSMFSTAMDPYEKAKASIKAKLEAAEDARRRLRSAAQALAAQAQAAGDAPRAQAALATVAETQGRAGGASFRYEWEWTLDDISQVPPEFLALNRPTMVAYVSRFRTSETIEGIPGITFRRVAKAIAR